MRLTRVLLGAAALLPTGALAQQTGVALEEVVVTAQRREESLQRVPLAVQAFNADQLEKHNIENATDLSKIVPALTSAESSRNQENYVIRGQSGSGASISGQQVTVPTYFSQVPLPIGDGGGPGRYFDLQNVQVLKGPQGTLFGRNSTGGAVLFEPRRPGNDVNGYVQLQAGNYSERGFEAALNMPVVADKLAVRLASKGEKRDGFTRNLTTGKRADNRNHIAGRASILFTPSDTVENLTVVDIFHSHTNGSGNVLSGVNPGAPAIAAVGAQTVLNALALQEAIGPRRTYSNVSGLNHAQAWGVANITSWKLSEEVTFKNIFGYRSFRELNRFDYDGSALSLLDFDTCTTPAQCRTSTPSRPWSVQISQITEEPQLQGRLFDQKLDYTLGLFYLRGTSPGSSYIHQTSIFGSQTDVNAFVRDSSRAAYGQLTYDFSDLVQGLKATAGYRYTRDKRGIDVTQVGSFRCTTGASGTAAPNPANAPQCTTVLDVKHNTSSYTFGLSYQVQPNVMLYVTHRRGYRAGGYNPLAGPALLASPAIPNAASLFTYGPETLTDTEGGIKADWNLGGMALRTNLAVFHDKLKKAQLNQSFSVPVGTAVQTVSALTNAAKAEVNGAEAELTLIPVKGLELTAAYAYTNAFYGPFQDYSRRDAANQPTLQDGRVFPFTPHHKLNVSARADLPIDPELGELSAFVSWSHKSTILLGLVPFYTAGGVLVKDPAAYQKPTNVIDLSLDWDNVAGSRFGVSFFMTNVTNTTYKIGGASLIASLGIDQAIYNEPRMFGVRVRHRFGG